jgi:hypothetical protein
MIVSSAMFVLVMMMMKGMKLFSVICATQRPIKLVMEGISKIAFLVLTSLGIAIVVLPWHKIGTLNVPTLNASYVQTSMV